MIYDYIGSQCDVIECDLIINIIIISVEMASDSDQFDFEETNRLVDNLETKLKNYMVSRTDSDLENKYRTYLEDNKDIRSNQHQSLKIDQKDKQ